MKKIGAFLLCAALLVSLLAGCESDRGAYVPTGDGLYKEDEIPSSVTTAPSVEQEVALVYYPEETLNPYVTADYTNRVLFALLYQGLFSVDGNYEVHPILCSGYSVTKDLKTYTFYLENATFSDGTAVTAADVAASLQAAKESAVYSGRLRYVTEISVSDENAVVVKLSTSYENLPLLLDIPIVKASDVASQRPIGSGPYYLQESMTGLRMVRRFDWWCSASMPVTATFVTLVEAQSPSQIRDAFEFSGVSLVCADPGSDSYVDFRSDYELWDCETGIFLYLGCNEKSKVFSDPILRQSLTYAIDRNLLVETYYDGFAQAASLPASPESPYYDKVLASGYDYDGTTLTEAVAAAQLEDNSVKLLVNKGDSRRVRVAEAIAQMLNVCGLNVTVSKLSGTDYTNALLWGNYDLHLGQTMLSANMDLTAFYSTSGALCFGGMSDPAILAICQDALENSGNYETMHRMVMEDAMLCPILFRSYAIYTTRGVFDVLEPARDNVLFYSLGKTMEEIYIQ